MGAYPPNVSRDSFVTPPPQPRRPVTIEEITQIDKNIRAIAKRTLQQTRPSTVEFPAKKFDLSNF